MNDTDTITRVPLPVAEEIEADCNMQDLRLRNEERLRSLKENPRPTSVSLPVQRRFEWPVQQRMTVQQLRSFLSVQSSDSELEVTISQFVPEFLKR